jgi:hypothetical protein
MTAKTGVPTEILRTLHRIHQQLQDLRERLARGPRIAAAHLANLGKLEALVTEAKAAALAAQKISNAKQGHLQVGETAVAKRRQQLREAKENREYQALVEQIAADEMANSVLADETLEALEKFDALTAKVKEAEAALAKGREDQAKSKADVDRQSPVIQGDIDRLEHDLLQAEQELPAEFREIYRRVTRSKGGDAMAPMTGEFCGGCNQHVPLNMCTDLMQSKPVFCKNCGRLLYLPENHAIT